MSCIPSSRTLLPLLLLTVLLVSFPASAESELTIRVGNFFPNYYRNADGNWEGIDAELGRALVERAGYTARFSQMPWLRALAAAEAGTVDVLVNANITAERSDYLHWIGPARYTQINLVVRQEFQDLSLGSWDDFVVACQQLGQRFGYQTGVKYSDEFHARLESDSAFRECFASSAKPLNARMAQHGRIIGYFSEVLDVQQELRRNPEYDLVLHPFIVTREPVFFGISKQAVDIATLISLYEAYESLVEDGTFAAIRSKWME